MIKSTSYRQFASRLNLFTATVFLVVVSTHLAPLVATAQVNMVSELTVEANRNDYSGPCPTEIKLSGKLKAEAALGVVRYQFVHSDGTQGAVSQLTIKSKGVFAVDETLPKIASWNDTVYLRVFLPAPLDSNRITIKGQCRAAALRQASTPQASASRPNPNPAILHRSSFRPDDRAEINRYRLSDGDVIMMTVEEDPGIAADQIEIVLKTDPNVTWWKSIILTAWSDARNGSPAGETTVNSISTQDDDHGPKAMRLNFQQTESTTFVFAKGKFLGVHTEMYRFAFWIDPEHTDDLRGKRVIFTWQKD